MKGFLEGDFSNISTQSTEPGLLNGALKWTSYKGNSIDLGLFESGVEVLWAFFHRAVIHRTYSPSGDECILNLPSPDLVSIHVGEEGYRYGLVFSIGMLLLNSLCFISVVPWFLNEHPIGPAVRMVKEQSYFDYMLQHKLPAHLLYQNLTINTEMKDVWNARDITVRVGESIQSQHDPSVGLLTIDKPKVVGPFSYSKKYI